MQTSEPTRSEEFMELITLHQSRLYGYIFALVHDLDVADDLYQQTAMVAWRKFDQYEADTNFGAWVCRIAQFELLTFRQKAGRETVVFSDQLVDLLSHRAAEREGNNTDDRRAALGGCVEKLKPEDREILDATYVQGEKADAIAEKTGRPVASIYNALSRIRRNLAECIRRVLAGDSRP
jgi:RNA polymerase sigma-70 factor (ECF subfamily)